MSSTLRGALPDLAGVNTLQDLGTATRRMADENFDILRGEIYRKPGAPNDEVLNQWVRTACEKYGNITGAPPSRDDAESWVKLLAVKGAAPKRITLADIAHSARYTTLFRTWLEVHGFQPTMVNARGLRTDEQKWSRALTTLRFAVWENIERYGETGYGDKPDAMDTVEYWLAHIEFDRMRARRFYH